MRISFDGTSFYLSFEQEQTERSIDERIAKIDLAKANLLEGLQAIDELKAEAERNKKEVEIAVEQVNRLERNKIDLQSELAAIKTVVQTDVSAFRRVAGVLGPAEIRRERLLGFFSGVVASLVASGIIAATVAVIRHREWIVWAIKHYLLSSTES